MKKVAVMLTAALALGACHYGKNEAGSSLERNKTYKEGKENGPEINADYVKGGSTAAKDTARKDSAAVEVMKEVHEAGH